MVEIEKNYCFIWFPIQTHIAELAGGEFTEMEMWTGKTQGEGTDTETVPRKRHAANAEFLVIQIYNNLTKIRPVQDLQNGISFWCKKSAKFINFLVSYKLGLGLVPNYWFLP